MTGHQRKLLTQSRTWALLFFLLLLFLVLVASAYFAALANETCCPNTATAAGARWPSGSGGASQTSAPSPANDAGAVCRTGPSKAHARPAVGATLVAATCSRVGASSGPESGETAVTFGGRDES